MGQRTSYPPGTFSWVDLATNDPAAAAAFYRGLFGWETDGEAPGAAWRLGGDVVCGLGEAANGPAGWTSYVTVADAGEVAERASRLGGRVVRAPADVPGAGRTALLEDPQGAVVAVREPAGRFGAELVNDVGCLCMNELLTTDVPAARAFYEALFGWTTEAWDTAPGAPPIVLAHNDGVLNASLAPVADGTPAHWRPCFTVASAEAALGRVRELGGVPVEGPVAIPDGSLAVARDAHGARFALFAGPVDP